MHLPYPGPVKDPVTDRPIDDDRLAPMDSGALAGDPVPGRVTGAVAGAIAGAVVGAVVAGPPGAVVVGALGTIGGAAVGATADRVDDDGPDRRS